MINKNKLVYTMYIRAKETIKTMMAAIFTVAITAFAMMVITAIIMLKAITQRVNPAFL